MQDFIMENITWLWRLPVNAFTVSIMNIPQWLVVAVIFVLVCDLVKLGIKIQEAAA